MRWEGGGFGYEPPEPEAVAGAAVGSPVLFGGGLPAAEADGLDDARFRPPGAADDLDDARFRPPAAHLAPAGTGPPVRPLRQDLKEVLLYALREDGVAFIALGALFLLALSMVPILFLPVLALTVCYPLAYLERVVQYGMQGKSGLPDWPEFHLSDLLSAGLRMGGVLAAAFAPAVALFLVASGVTLASLGGEPAAGLRSIGPHAHREASGTPQLAPGSAWDPTEFLTPAGDDVAVGRGKWTVLGLLGRYTADDTGFDQMMADMPTGMLGISIMHGDQVYDLDRVGVALGDRAQVFGAYADPDGALLRELWPFTDPGRGDEALDEEPPDEAYQREAFGDRAELEETLARARGAAELGGRVAGTGRDPFARPRDDPFRALRLITSRGMDFPAPFAEVRRLPAVYVIDPQGRIAREYPTGVYDEKLYADVEHLMRGGDGDTRARRLPAHAHGATSAGGGAGATLAWGLFGALLLAGALYLPMAALLAVAFGSGATPFSYAAGVRSIVVSWKDYLALAGLMVGIDLGAAALNGWVGGLLDTVLPGWLGPPLVGFVAAGVVFYSKIVMAHGIGRYYRANQEALGWFGR